MFTTSERLRNHYVGQQLLRLSLRRKSERNLKQELIEHTGDKKVYEKLLSALNVWNMRATYYDFKLNILEQNPEIQLTKMSNGNQQLASSYQMAMYQQALFNNVANACHLLFKEHLLKGKQWEDLVYLLLNYPVHLPKNSELCPTFPIVIGKLLLVDRSSGERLAIAASSHDWKPSKHTLVSLEQIGDEGILLESGGGQFGKFSCYC